MFTQRTLLPGMPDFVGQVRFLSEQTFDFATLDGVGDGDGDAAPPFGNCCPGSVDLVLLFFLGLYDAQYIFSSMASISTASPKIGWDAAIPMNFIPLLHINCVQFRCSVHQYLRNVASQRSEYVYFDTQTHSYKRNVDKRLNADVLATSACL